MTSIVLVLLYIWKGQLAPVYTQSFESEKACMEAGIAKLEALSQDPRFDGALFGACLPLQASSK